MGCRCSKGCLKHGHTYLVSCKGEVPLQGFTLYTGSAYVQAAGSH